MHLLARSVLTLVILPLALSCESANIENKVAEDYRNVIEPRMRHIKDKIDQLNLNCTTTLREAEKNQSILQKMCRSNAKLRRINHRMQSEVINSRPDFPDLRLLVEDINNSLNCWCHKKHGQREHSKQQPIHRKWSFCKVKYILSTLQTCFEQYNASQSDNT